MDNLRSTTQEIFTIFAIMSLAVAFGVGIAIGGWLWFLLS